MIDGSIATIYVSDMDRAVEFYTQTLGLRLVERAGNEWSSIDAGGGASIGLHGASPHGPMPGASGAISVGLSVRGDLDAFVAGLAARGVAFRGPIRGDANGGIRLAFFGDPDGNDLYLVSVRDAYGGSDAR